MKAKVLLLLAAVCSLSVTAQKQIRIGYIDMEYILENVEEYQEANTQLANKVQKWKVEIEQQKAEIEQMKKDLQAEKVLLTKELIEEREEDIKYMEKTMIEYQQDRFGPQGDLVQQRKLLIQPIQDQVFNAVQEIASGRQYDFIFDSSADVVMLYAHKRHDISDMILRKINANRKQTQASNKKNAKNKFEEEVEEVNPVVAARKKAAQEKRDAQIKAMEEKRQQKLKEREDRKKAYEARRKKLLEEREAKKKKQTETKKDSTSNN